MIRTQITLGLVLMVAAIVTFSYVAANEEQRLAETEEAQLATRVQNGAELFHTACANCHGERAEGTPGLCPPLNNPTLLEHRMEEVGWSGSLHSYLVATISGGRPSSTRPDQYQGNSAEGMAMPFWGQEYGGPLRADQIEDIAYFLENFEPKEVEVEEPQEPAYDPDADPVAIGQAVYEEKCMACHELDAVESTGGVGPTHNGLAETAAQRVESENYAGEATDAAGYIKESILDPGIHVVEGYQNQMPPFGNLSDQEVEGLVEFLMEQ